MHDDRSKYNHLQQSIHEERQHSGDYHDGHQGSKHSWRGNRAHEHVGKGNVKDWLQGLDGVGQRDGHSRKGQVGSNVPSSVHEGRGEDELELLCSDRLQLQGKTHPGSKGDESNSDSQKRFRNMRKAMWGNPNTNQMEI